MYSIYWKGAIPVYRRLMQYVASHALQAEQISVIVVGFAGLSRKGS